MSAIISVSSTVPHHEDPSKVLGHILECVQQCQKRYGGKTELATEFDNCVAALCLSLESVFLHGLRNKPQESQKSSKFQHVSEIVTNTLLLNHDSCCKYCEYSAIFTFDK